MISKGLADGKASGYIFSVTGTPTDFAVTAVPENVQHFRRTFYSDQTLVIRENWSQEPTTANSDQIK